MKILVSAYACNPDLGSEEGVGWGWVEALACLHELHVITAEFHRESIESKIEDWPGAPKFHYVRHRPWHYRPSPFWKRIEGSLLKPIMNSAYRLWLRDAMALAICLHREHRFDLAHQLTYVGFRFPGHLWKLPIPFVWGPLGGLEQTNWRLLPALGWRGAFYYAARNAVNAFDKRCRPSVRQAMRKAHGGLIAATSGIRAEIQRLYGEDAEVVSEIGLPPGVLSGFSEPAHRWPGEPLRVAWIGNLLPGKALPFLLRALRLLPAGVEIEVRVFGDGPEGARWRRQAAALGVESRLSWHGRKPRGQVLRMLKESHVLAVTSVYDLTSTVLVEALANGVPVVCPDHCGFRDAIDSTCGVRFPACDSTSFVRGLADGLAAMCDEQSRFRLAQGALIRAGEYSWEAKARRVDAIYRRKADVEQGHMR